MLLDILCVVFFFFTNKQSYAGRHFTGSGKLPKLIIRTASMLNALMLLAYFIYSFVENGFVHAAILFLVSFVFSFIANIALSAIVMLKTRKEYNVNEHLLYGVYNRNCDILSTITAYVGILINVVIAIFAFVNIL